MEGQFCTHLEEYGFQFVKTEAAYQAFNKLMDRIIEDGNPEALSGSLEQALGEWRRENEALRDQFLELFNSGRILLPRGALKPGRRHDNHPTGHAKCSDCFTPVPRLEFKEWQLAHSGAVNFRGQELSMREPVGS